MDQGIETQLEWRKMKRTGPGDVGTDKFKRIGERVKFRGQQSGIGDADLRCETNLPCVCMGGGPSSLGFSRGRH